MRVKTLSTFCKVSAEKLFTNLTFGRIVAAMPTPTKPTIPPLTALELRRKISVRQAAELNGISEDTFRRHFWYLIKKITPRRDGVMLSDALELPKKTAAS
jgi:hypothetical protein